MLSGNWFENALWMSAQLKNNIWLLIWKYMGFMFKDYGVYSWQQDIFQLQINQSWLIRNQRYRYPKRIPVHNKSNNHNFNLMAQRLAYYWGSGSILWLLVCFWCNQYSLWGESFREQWNRIESSQTLYEHMVKTSTFAATSWNANCVSRSKLIMTKVPIWRSVHEMIWKSRWL